MGQEFVIRPEVAGGLGSDSILDHSVHPPVVHRLHYVFSGWLGDDIVESFPCYLVSTRLAGAITHAGLSGVRFDDAIVSKDPQFVRFFPEVAASLPEWRWLRPTGQAHESDFWQMPNGRLVVSAQALEVVRGFNLHHCEVFAESAPGDIARSAEPDLR